MAGEPLKTAPSVPAELMSLVYDELRSLAQSFLQQERPDHTLSATEIVHEVYLRVARQNGATWNTRVQFVAVAAQMIRRILVDHARHRKRAKRGGGHHRIELRSDLAWTDPKTMDLIALDEALIELAGLNERQARIVELRFFGGLSVEEAAEMLQVSPRTVDGDWSMARAWLRRSLKAAPQDRTPEA